MADLDNAMSESEKKKEDWMNAKWRPMMGWMYMLVCTCDFVIFPVLWSIFHAIIHSGNVTQWNPLTLQGAGLFHMAMGAIIGVAAFGRTQEKLAGKANDNAGLPSFGSPSPMPMPTPMSPTATAMPAAARPMPAAVAPRPMPVAPPPAPSMDDLPDDPPMRNTRND